MTSTPETPVPAAVLGTAAGTGTTHGLPCWHTEAEAAVSIRHELCNAPVNFWVCPDEQFRRTGIVQWVGDVAHCRQPDCGRTSADPLRFEIDVPLLLPPFGHGPGMKPCEPLNANWRIHWTDRRERVAMVREVVTARARQAGIPKCRHLTVTLHYQPGDNRRRDVDNLVPTLKAACDALARGKRRDWIGLELVPDDTPQHMTKRMPVIHPGPDERRLWLEIEVTA